MLTLNLLPNHYKHEYSFEKKKRFTVFLCIFVSLILIVFNTLLFSTYLFLTINENALKNAIEAQQSTDVVKRLTDIEKEIRAANTKIGTLVSAEKEIVPIASIAERTASLIGDGAYMKTLAIDASSKNVNFTGFADARSEVLAVAKKMAESDFIDQQSVKNPVKNILKESNIDFTFSFAFKDSKKTEE